MTEHPVLVVDDEPAMRELLVRVLARAGLGALEAGTVTEAEAILASQPVSLVLLDCRLGPDNGVDLLRRLRTQPETITLPVILVTANTQIADRVDGLEAGANDFLTKPVDFDELVARVRAQLRTRNSWIDALEQELHGRIRTIRSLGELMAHQGLADRAAFICREIARDPDVTAAAVVSFAAGRVAVPLATEGFDAALQAGRPLPSLIGKDLWQRASEGPWLERPGEGSVYLLEWLAADCVRAFVPLMSDGRLVGLFIRGVRTGAATPHQRQLAAAIDIADTITSLLSPRLADHGARAASRAELELLLESDGFRPVFQPIIDLRDERTVGYEALTRFDDGVAPLVRFTEATDLGLGRMLETATLAAAIRAAAQLPEEAYLSLNVSPELLLEPDALVRLVPLLEERQLVLELTEHDPIDDYVAVREAVGNFGRVVDLSVDDTGSGFASLSHVLALDPAFVKLDRSWIQGIDGDPARQALVAGLAYFAGETGCRLVAEGIETAEEHATVSSLGVHLGQGFLFGRPSAIGSFALADH